MTPSDVARQKFMRLMAEVEDLEEQASALEARPRTPEVLQQLQALQLKLAERRTELTRVSDGCGTPHAK
jgi:hypothetical protein